MRVLTDLEVVTRGARPETQSPDRQVELVTELGRAPTRVWVCPVLTRQLTQLPLVYVWDQIGGQEALLHAPL